MALGFIPRRIICRELLFGLSKMWVSIILQRLSTAKALISIYEDIHFIFSKIHEVENVIKEPMKAKMSQLRKKVACGSTYVNGSSEQKKSCSYHALLFIYFIKVIVLLSFCPLYIHLCFKVFLWGKKIWSHFTQKWLILGREECSWVLRVTVFVTDFFIIFFILRR